MSGRAALRKEIIEFLSYPLTERGFQHGRDLVFYRKTETGVYHLIIGEIAHGANLNFFVTCLVKEYSESTEKEMFQDIPMTCGGPLGEGFYGNRDCDLTDSSPDEVLEFLQSIIVEIDRYAIPWFDTVSSRSAYVGQLPNHIRAKLKRRGLLEKVLQGCHVS